MTRCNPDMVLLGGDLVDRASELSAPARADRSGESTSAGSRPGRGASVRWDDADVETLFRILVQCQVIDDQSRRGRGTTIGIDSCEEQALDKQLTSRQTRRLDPGPSEWWNGGMNTNGTAGPLFTWTQAIYALHAFSILTGILGAATVVGAFLTGWPSIVAVILNYVKRGDVRGTWLDSHFRWQIRTFWYGLLWVSLCVLFIVVTFGIGIVIAWLPLLIVTIWFVYRTVRGWLALREGRPMYV